MKSSWWHWCARTGPYSPGWDRFFEVLRKTGLLLEPKRSETPRTTQSYHLLPVFINLIKALVQVKEPNEVWVGDLTYLRTEEGFMFLALLTDKMSRHIVGYHYGTAWNPSAASTRCKWL